MLMGFAGFLAMQAIEGFFIRDPRFALPPPEWGEQKSNLEISGVTHASQEDLTKVFATDFARSIYLLPLAERRRNLLAVDWVRDASVARIWPNRVAVKIQERRPVAFVSLTAQRRGEPAVSAMIDADGVILAPPAGATYNLPVLVGVGRLEPEASRRERVRRMMTMLEDLGPLGSGISEIDVRILDNLKITLQMNDRAVILMLGNQRFRQRLQNFLTHSEQIRKRLPNATILDLRLEDRITAVEGVGSE
jgi:cell division protein FtsQ